MFADKISPLAQNTEFAGKITDASSPEKLTIFSFDILHYILKNSDKVVYPRCEDGSSKVEVGRSQYLSMREKVIEHHRKTIELTAQLRAGRGRKTLDVKGEG